MSRYKKAAVGIVFLILLWVMFFFLLFIFKLLSVNKVLNIRGEIDIFIELNDKGTELYTILSGEKDYTKNMMILGSSVANNIPKDFDERIKDSLDSMAKAKGTGDYYLNVWNGSELLKSFGAKTVSGSVRSAMTKDTIDKFFHAHNSPLEGLGGCIIEASRRTDVPAIVIMSVAIHESGWGSSDLAKGECPTSSPYSNPPKKSSNNLFGYKGTGTSGSCRWRTWECLPAEPSDSLGECTNPCDPGEKCYYVVAEFRSYLTMCDSIEDFADLMKASRYQKAYSARKNPELMIKEIGRAGYATDPNWTDKVIGHMETFLNEYPYAVIPAEGSYAEIPLPNGERGKIEMVI